MAAKKKVLIMKLQEKHNKNICINVVCNYKADLYFHFTNL